jgi:two-component system, response regulator
MVSGDQGARESVEVLLVEDDPSDVELTLLILKREKLANRIDIAHDGEEALDYLFRRGAYKERTSDHEPRLVLLDLKLPKVSGLEVLRELKADPRTRSIPIVVMTSSREERDLVDSYSLGVNSYIQKPIDFEQFRDTVRQVGFYWLLVNQRPE